MLDVLYYYNLEQIINVTFLFINIIFILLYFRQLRQNRHSRSVLLYIICVAFVFLLQPLFSFVFTYNIQDFANYLKLLSWLTIIPLAFLAFQELSYIRGLTYSVLWSFGLIVICLIAGNILKIGSTAYDAGLFYLGFYDTGSTVSLTLVCFLPFFFLPSGKKVKEKPVNVKRTFVIILNFVLVLLLMKRSGIIAYVICLYTIILLFGKNRYVRFSLMRGLIISSFFLLLFSSSLLYVWVAKPEVLEYRFKDVMRYRESGDAALLGGGRVGLLGSYLSYYFRLPIIQQLIGVDVAGYIDKTKDGYLYTDFKKVPHNDFLETMFRGGILGLILYLLMFLYFFLKVLKHYITTREPISAQLSICMFGMFCVYIISAFAGMMFRIFPMTCFAMLLGACLGFAGHTTLAKKETVPAFAKEAMISAR